jgi:hypothetical protein
MSHLYDNQNHLSGRFFSVKKAFRIKLEFRTHPFLLFPGLRQGGSKARRFCPENKLLFREGRWAKKPFEG